MGNQGKLRHTFRIHPSIAGYCSTHRVSCSPDKSVNHSSYPHRERVAKLARSGFETIGEVINPLFLTVTTELFRQLLQRISILVHYTFGSLNVFRRRQFARE